MHLGENILCFPLELGIIFTLIKLHILVKITKRQIKKQVISISIMNVWDSWLWRLNSEVCFAHTLDLSTLSKKPKLFYREEVLPGHTQQDTCSPSLLLHSTCLLHRRSQENACPSPKKGTHNTRSSPPAALSKLMRETPASREASNSQNYTRAAWEKLNSTELSSSLSKAEPNTVNSDASRNTGH